MEMAELNEWIIAPFASQKINLCMDILAQNRSLFYFQAELVDLSCAGIFFLLKREIVKNRAFLFIFSYKYLSWQEPWNNKLPV